MKSGIAKQRAWIYLDYLPTYDYVCSIPLRHASCLGRSTS